MMDEKDRARTWAVVTTGLKLQSPSHQLSEGIRLIIVADIRKAKDFRFEAGEPGGDPCLTSTCRRPIAPTRSSTC